MSDPDLADLQNISAILRGHSDAYRGIVERYQGYLFRLAVAYLGQPEEAEDAVQEIFLRAFKALGSFELSRRFKPWLVSIAVNYLKTAHGRLQRYRNRSKSTDQLVVDASDSPEEQVMVKQARDSVRAAVRRLPERLQSPVILYYLENMSVGEISEILEISVENAKSRLHRARKKLREILEKDATADDFGEYNKREDQ
jgi:RNA polymerase sigma-70 factor (ECF subfamily)